MSLAALGATDIGIKTFDRAHDPGESGEAPVISPEPDHHVQCQPLVVADDGLLHAGTVLSVRIWPSHGGAECGNWEQGPGQTADV